MPSNVFNRRDNQNYLVISGIATKVHQNQSATRAIGLATKAYPIISDIQLCYYNHESFHFN